MKNFLLYLCKKTFAIGYVVAGLALTYQAIEIFMLKSAQGISLATFAVFSFLHLNGVAYSYFVAKDRILFWGIILNALSCIAISLLKVIYG